MDTNNQLPSLDLILNTIDSVGSLYIAGEPIGKEQSRFFREQTKTRLVLAGLFMYADFAEMPVQLQEIVAMPLTLGEGIATQLSHNPAFDCSSFRVPESRTCFDMIEARLEDELRNQFHKAFSSVMGMEGFPNSEVVGTIHPRGSFEYPKPFPNSATFCSAFEFFCSNTAPATIRNIAAAFSRKYAHVVLRMIDALLGESALFLPFDLQKKYHKKLIAVRQTVSSWKGMYEDGDVYYTDSLVRKLSSSLSRIEKEIEHEMIYDVFQEDVKHFLHSVLRLELAVMEIMIKCR